MILTAIETAHTVTPSSRNGLGVEGEGIGEGAIAAPSTVVNGVLDDLSRFGVDQLDMPLIEKRALTETRVWRAIRALWEQEGPVAHRPNRRCRF
ncbi:hypothetical protein JCM17823_11410 [Halorubrum gandharaense]